MLSIALIFCARSIPPAWMWIMPKGTSVHCVPTLCTGKCVSNQWCHHSLFFSYFPQHKFVKLKVRVFPIASLSMRRQHYYYYLSSFHAARFPIRVLCAVFSTIINHLIAHIFRMVWAQKIEQRINKNNNILIDYNCLHRTSHRTSLCCYQQELPNSIYIRKISTK